MFKSRCLVIVLAFLLLACFTPPNATAQLSGAGALGTLSSPTNNIYFSTSVTVTSTSTSVAFSGTPFLQVNNVYYAFYLSVDNGNYDPWSPSNTAIAMAITNAGTIYLDQYGSWSMTGNQSALSGWLSNGSHTAYAQEWIAADVVFTGPDQYSTGIGNYAFSPVTFGIF